MDTIFDRCAGLDVHKETVVTCVRRIVNGKVQREVRTFNTTTEDLQTLLSWLKETGCTHVAMEATGVYWKPIWNILSDGDFDLVLANAKHIKNVPGRKTDVNDAMWIADLLSCGLIRGSFVPDQSFRELRSLLRTRKQMVGEQTRHTQRLQKILEEANVKLDSVISEILGKSGRRIIEGMIQGIDDPAALARLAGPRIKATQQTLCAALHGRVTDHHRFLLRLHLDQYDTLAKSIDKIDRQIDRLCEEIDAAMRKQQEAKAAEEAEEDRRYVSIIALIALLCTIPGIQPLTARTILAEIGCDMSRFPTAGHLVSWAGLCPGQNESAGKRKSSRLRKGDRWLKTAMVQAAVSASRKKNSYYQAQYHRICSKHGKKKAHCAVAASMLTAIYHMLKNGTVHQDLGGDYFDRRKPETKLKHLVNRITKLGYEVQIKPVAQAA